MLLGVEGWRHVPSEDDDGGTAFERDNVRLELTFLVRGDDGGVCTPFRHGNGRWPDGALGSDVIELLGTRARVVSLASLVEAKSSLRSDPADAAKDRADHHVLGRILENRRPAAG